MTTGRFIRLTFDQFQTEEVFDFVEVRKLFPKQNEFGIDRLVVYRQIYIVEQFNRSCNVVLFVK